MILIVQELLEATGRGVRASLRFGPRTPPLRVELIGDEARLRACAGPLDVELDYDAITAWARSPKAPPGLFPVGPDEVAIVGQVAGLVPFDASPPIVDLRVGQGLVSLESDERTPKLQEGDLVAVRVKGLRCYPTWV